MMEPVECTKELKPLKVYLLNPNDVVIKDNVMIRMKRKYGKFKRTVFQFEARGKN